MSTAANDFLSKLLATFRLEADEHLRMMKTGLLALEKTTTAEERQPLLESVIREAHSLKGAARTVDLMEIEMLCQSMEGIFARLKRGELSLSSEEFAAVRSALDTMDVVLSAPQEAHATRVSDAVQRLTELERASHQQHPSVVVPPTAPSPSPAPVLQETILGVSAVSISPETLPPPASDPAASDFLSKLLAAFRLEADEHLKTMTIGLLALEKATTPEERQPLLESVFREAHSLKGAARAVDLTEVEMLCQSVEGIFAQLKRGACHLSAAGFDAVHYALDTVDAVLSAPQEVYATQVSDAVQRLTQLAQQTQREEATPPPPSPMFASRETKQLSAITAPEEHTAKAVPVVSTPQRSDGLTPTPKQATGETIRVSTARLDSLFLQAEEMLTVKLSIHQHVTDLQDMVALLGDWKKEWAKISAEVRKLQRAIEDKANQAIHSTSYLQTAPAVVEFLYWNERQLSVLENHVHGLAKVIESDQQTIGTLVDNLLEDTKRVLMLPFSSLLEIFPKMVRDLARSLGKEVELTMRGGEVDIDKRILEELKIPLIHLLRNSLDHGLEIPEVRRQQGKLACGSLQISVSQTGGSSVEILVSDDGAGIDAAKVKQAAVKKGLLTAHAAEALDEQAAIDLIFRSEVTTSPIVTDISGRGLGMAIGREKVENLGGQLTVETSLHQGTTFRIVLPLTLATFRGVFVRAAGAVFAVPTTHVERVVRLEPQEITTLEGKQAVLLDGQPIAFAALDEILQLPRKKQSEAQETAHVALILESAEKRLACGVDEVLNEQEVLFKQLGIYLSQVPNVAGATVLGSGQVIPVLHIPDVLNSVATGTQTYRRRSGETDDTEAVAKSVLLAEDSVTSRMLLKGILESGGYQVTTAVDGLDAFTTLQKTNFDLVVSDVEMPRMNGFELTTKIRSNSQGSHLPVVLVTGLDSREDRERGIEAGADAYIVKTNFDQSNLLDVVQRLL